MDKTKQLEKRLEKYQSMIRWFLIVSLFAVGVAGYMTFEAGKYEMLYNQAVDYCAEQIVTAAQMVVACQQLSNVTNEEIAHKVLDDYIDGGLK